MRSISKLPNISPSHVGLLLPLTLHVQVLLYPRDHYCINHRVTKLVCSLHDECRIYWHDMTSSQLRSSIFVSLHVCAMCTDSCIVYCLDCYEMSNVTVIMRRCFTYFVFLLLKFHRHLLYSQVKMDLSNGK